MGDYYGQGGRRAGYDDYDDYDDYGSAGGYDRCGSAGGYDRYEGSRGYDDYGRSGGYSDSGRQSRYSDYGDDGYGDAYDDAYGSPRSRRRSSYDDPSSRRSRRGGQYGSYSSGQRSSQRTQYYDDGSYSGSSRSRSSGQYGREAQGRSSASSGRSRAQSQSRTSTRGYSSRGQASAYGASRSRQAGSSRGYSSRNPQVYAGPYGIEGNGYGSSGLGGFLDRFGLTVPKLIIGIVAVIVIIVLLVTLVRCAAGIVSGSDSSTGAQVAVTTTSGESASSSSSAATTLAANEGVEDPWVEGGRFTTGDAELDQMVKTFCDDNSNPDLSAADNAFNVYCAVVWGEYIESDDNQEPLGPNWDIEYAKQYITAGGGNCYNFCAFNEYVLKYFGYSDATAEPCIVLRQSGDYGDHGLVFVTNIEDGRRCLCDSAYGSNGWMVDIDAYTMQVRNIGQDPSEFTVAPFEDISVAPWYDGA